MDQHAVVDNVPNRVTNAPWSRTVTVWPGARYEYQACGKEASYDQFDCVGPDGGSGTTEKFIVGPLQARSAAASDAHDTNAILNGSIESAQTRDTYFWADWGTTTSYGSHTPVPFAYPLQANQPFDFAYRLDGLQQGTTYHYRVCASYQAAYDPQALCGVDQTFKTNVGNTNVSCGQTITSNLTLGKDLTGCTGDGLVVGAPNITLDLNGYAISSDGQKEQLCGPGAVNGPDFGVDNSAGHDGVKIKNGTVVGFEEGIELIAAADNAVTNMDVSGVYPNTGGGVGSCQLIYAERSDRVRISDSTVDSNHIRGIGIKSTQGALIQNNEVKDHRHAGIAVWASSGTRVLDNRVYFHDNENGQRSEFGIRARSRLEQQHSRQKHRYEPLLRRHRGRRELQRQLGGRQHGLRGEQRSRAR